MTELRLYRLPSLSADRPGPRAESPGAESGADPLLERAEFQEEIESLHRASRYPLSRAGELLQQRQEARRLFGNAGSLHIQHYRKRMDVSLLMSPQAKHQRMYRGASLHSEASQVELNRATTHKTSAVVVSPEDTSGYDSSFVKGLLEAERKQMLDEQRSSFKGAKVSFMGDLRTWTTSPYQKYERKIFKGGVHHLLERGV